MIQEKQIELSIIEIILHFIKAEMHSLVGESLSSEVMASFKLRPNASRSLRMAGHKVSTEHLLGATL